MKLSLSFLFVFIFCHLHAQDSDNSELEKLIESSYYNQDNEIDYSELEAMPRKIKKLNLNTVNSIDFHAMNLISFIQVEEIIKHLKQYGPIKSKYELQTIEGLDSSTISVLLRAFEISEFSLQILIKQKHQELLRLKYSYRIEKSLGFQLNDSNRFLGSRSKIALLYQSEAGNLDYGFHIEKDAGETEKMMFQSAYLLLKPKNKIQNILLGDQQINLAQGLTLGTGIGSGKSALVMQIMRNNLASKPYKSFNETGFLRGMSIKTKIQKNIEVVLFTGIRQLDSKPKSDSSNIEFGSILNTGYYRNAAEQKSRHQLFQYLTGLHSLYKEKNFEIGSSLVYHKINLNPFTNEFNSNTDQTYISSNGLRTGLDWKIHFKNNLVFGEISSNTIKFNAMVIGLLKPLGKKTDLSLLYRYYANNDEIQMSNGFGSTSNNSNEKGFYLGISSQLPAKFNLNFYNDISLYKQPKYRTDANSYQTEQMLEIAYKTKNPFSIYFRYKHAEHLQNSENDEAIHSLDRHQKSIFRVHSEVKFEKIKIRNRIEYVNYSIKNQNPSFGSLIYQDLQFSILKKVNCTIRYSYFNSDDFNSRTFAYENDVPGSFNIPSYIGKGSRTYILIKYQIQKDLQIWIRFAHSSYAEISSIGAGLNAIPSPHVNDLNLQIQWKL